MEHNWTLIAIWMGFAAIVAGGIRILLLASRRGRPGTPPVANPNPCSDLYQGIAAFLILLIGLPILWIGGRSLADELAVFWKLERKTMYIADVYTEHERSFHEGGVSYSLLVVLTGKIDGEPREVQTWIGASGSLLGVKSQFEALRGKQLKIWTSPGSSHFRLQRHFVWDGIFVGLLGVSFVLVSAGAMIYGWRNRSRRQGPCWRNFQ
ncbi:hypothetical protein [Steroidobacter agaridevorans]|uniref:hypothetical protein n=1 Tax=Steroidobacter agaridevorans TaxID=2695856 RepID=UPI001329FAFE|nr:hypothetical protein [Steroidobacter agaridevorans]GFE89588.1 hypothetical protein GCM10011488_45420 [Steroidobacter agaridevorans]